jgi:hypothetical protein
MILVNILENYQKVKPGPVANRGFASFRARSIRQILYLGVNDLKAEI